MTRLTACLFVALAVTAGGCSDSTAPDCTGAVTLSVGAGTAPSFSWSPNCQLEGLAVTGPGGVLWSIEGTSGTNSISPSVHFGSTPKGARVVNSASALTAGTTYQVTVYRFDDGHGGTIESAGAASFTP